jgi:uncharacterized protein (TIGR00106 family)
MNKHHNVIADFSIIPVGHAETSLGSYVAAAINALEKVDGLDFEVTPMGTVLAAKDLETIFKAVQLAHEVVVAKGVKRVESILRLDDRRDKQRTMKDKVEAIKGYMKQP